MFAFRTVRIVDGAGRVQKTLKDSLVVSIFVKTHKGRLTVTERILGVESQKFYLGEQDRVETETHWQVVILTTMLFIGLFSLIYQATAYF